MRIFLLQANISNLKSIFEDLVFQESPPQVPLGLCYIGAILGHNNYEVKIFDNYLYKKPVNYVLNEIIGYKPDVVGFSVVCTNLKESLELAELIKKSLPKAITIFGGPQATISPEDLIKYPYIDFVVAGEGENVIIEILRCLEGKSKNIKTIKGLFFKDDKGKAIFTGNRILISNLDVLPLPARHLVELKKYPNPNLRLIDVAPVYTISTSRGCPYRCKFCSSSIYWDRTFRSRSAKNIVGEIDYLIRKYRAKGINFREDNFMIEKKRVVDICNELTQRKINIEWLCESRVDNIEPYLLENMYKAGCRGIWCGVESGSQKILDFINKGYKVEQVRRAFRLLKNFRIKTGAGFMLGFPNETMDDVKKTLDLAKEIDPDWFYFQPYIGYPKSELYNYIIKNKMYTKEWFGIYEVNPNLLDKKDIPEIVEWMKAEFYKNKRKKLKLKKKLYLAIVTIIELICCRNSKLYFFLKNIKNGYIDKYFN